MKMTPAYYVSFLILYQCCDQNYLFEPQQLIQFNSSAVLYQVSQSRLRPFRFFATYILYWWAGVKGTRNKCCGDYDAPLKTICKYAALKIRNGNKIKTLYSH